VLEILLKHASVILISVVTILDVNTAPWMESQGQLIGKLNMKLLMLSDFWPTAMNPISGVFVQYQVAEYVRQAMKCA